MCIEADTQDGQRHSVILQNAETVKLVGPAAQSSDAAGAASSPPGTSSAAADVELDAHMHETATTDSKQASRAWQTRAVSEMVAGDVVYVSRSEAGRHMGHAVQETLIER